ncbi:MAG TPA: hypothetical protein VFG54_10600 [Prolixibacteraceae bacterium]|nr:hypothetical protein [Prolixibacteraceae bacterium]
MQKSLFLTILLLILFLFNGEAQIANEIKAYVDSTEVQVINGRKLLIQKLTEKDDHKAKEIYLYLSALSTDNNSAAFNYTENIYANLLFENWNTLITYMQEYRQKISTFTYPANDPLARVFYDRISTVTDSLMLESQESGLDKESQKVIQLTLHLLKVRTADPEYDRLYKAFRQEYKQSVYSDYVTSYLPAASVKASMSFSGGSGIIFPTGKLGDSFSPNARGNFSIDFSVNKVYVSFYLTGSGLHLKSPFTATSQSDTLFFDNDESFSYLEGGMKTGYFLLRNKWLQVAPYVNISGTTLESKRFDDEEENDKEFAVLNSFTFGPGIHTAIKLYENTKTDVNGYQNLYFFSLKVDAGYNLHAKYDQKLFKGNTPNVMVGLVMGIGNF